MNLFCLGSWICYSPEMPINMEFKKAEVFCDGPNRQRNRNDKKIWIDV